MYFQLHRRWPLRPLALYIRQRQFFATHEWRGLHFGVFDTFDDARQYCAVHGISAHYELDHEWWAGVQDRVFLHDYPMLYWLNRLLTSGSRVADLGGSVGVSYYAFKHYLYVEPDVRWLVCELAEVVEEGRWLAKERQANALSFTDSFDDMDGHDVLMAAGSIQFIEEPLGEILKRLQTPPPHLLINRIPVHGSRSFVTLQNTGSAIAPCHIFARQRFLSELREVGYELIDEWSCPGRSINVPLRPEYRIAEFSGFCFARSRPAH